MARRGETPSCSGARLRRRVHGSAQCCLFRGSVCGTVTIRRVSVRTLDLHLDRKDDEGTNAIFLEADDIVRIPVLAARDQYWGTELYSIDWNYPDSEMKARRALRDAIFGDDELSEELLAHAAALDRPFYVVLRDIHANEGARFKRLSAFPHLKRQVHDREHCRVQARPLAPRHLRPSLTES